MNEKRLDELETKVAYQEHTLQQLNEVIARQQQQIDQLETTCELLIERIKAVVEVAQAGSDGDERPPHY
ncbi:MAG TPA: SlyX family protein [Gammaproteobacteria bacterium]|nr:SlyX family protein [Gammaproteobacteria bacterium]